jgi:exosortase/archaeosortase family protein
MGLDVWGRRLAEHRRATSLTGLLIAFTGVSMVFNPTHAVDLQWIGLPLLVAGATLLAWVLWPRTTVPTVERLSLGARLIHRLTLRSRLVRLFPAFGIALFVADLSYNAFLSATPALLAEDILVLLSASALLGYGFVPAQYTRERDFVFLFFFSVDLILVVPLLAVRLAAGNMGASVDVYSWTALAPEVSAILSMLGVPNSVHGVPGYTAPGLSFTPTRMGTPVTLVITTACSGIYSFGIFAAAFVAFVLTEYTSPSRRLWLFLGLGFLASYAANLLRMVMIVLVGYATDSAETDLQNLLLAHSYAGWVIFIGWLALFWGVLFKFLPIEADVLGHAPTTVVALPPRPRGSFCGICQEALSPAIAGMRCACGALYHRACLANAGRCPACHRDVADTRMGLAEGQ